MFDDPTPQSPATKARRVARRAAPVLAVLSIAVAAPLATSEIVVQRGQTLSGIAKDEQVTVARLAAFNGIVNPNLIYEGQVLQVPPPDGDEFNYTVAPGDSLERLARRFGTTVDAIAKRNDLANVDRIIAGKSIVIPARGASSSTTAPPTTPAPPAAEQSAEAPTAEAPSVTPAAAPTTTAAPATTVAPPTTQPPATQPPATTVAPPTTAAPATTVAPPPTEAPAPPANPGVVVSTIWVVQPGDTITSVAARFGLTPGSLAAANRVTVGAALTPGQYLFVPQR